MMHEVCRRATVLALIWCSVHFFGPVPGGIQHAVYIANRESHLNPAVTSPTGCMGVYQWCPSTWDSILSRWPEMNLWASTNAYNARGNVMRAIRFAHESGWGPWGVQYA